MNFQNIYIYLNVPIYRAKQKGINIQTILYSHIFLYIIELSEYYMYSTNIHLSESFVFSYRENLYFSENFACGTKKV